MVGLIRVPAALVVPVLIVLWLGAGVSVLAGSSRGVALFGIPALTLTLSALA